MPEAAAAPAARPAPATADALLKRLEWTVLRRLDGLLQGDYRTVFRGTGLDLADLREYQHHDDVRHIDWNVTARLQVPHVRQFTEDRDLTAWFLLDLSGSVHFGTTSATRMAVAEAFTALVARLLTRHGNRVGALFYRDRVCGQLPAGNGRMHVLRLMAEMRRHALAPSTPPSPPPARGRADPPRPGTRLAELLAAGEGQIRRRSMVFVVSDFLSEPGWVPVLGRLARRHDVLAVRLTDPSEHELPALGLVTLEDAETGEQIFVDTTDPAFRERYADLALRSQQALEADLVRAGVDSLEIATDDDLFDTVLRYTDLRRRRVRGHGHLAAAGAAA